MLDSAQEDSMKSVNDSNSWSIFGYGTSTLGVGEAARRLNHLLLACGLDINFVNLNSNNSDKSIPLPRSHNYGAALNSIYCVNADRIGHLFAEKKLDLTSSGKRVGYWAWELPDFPNSFVNAANLLDEIWTLSEFSRSSIEDSTKAVVRCIEIPVPTLKAKHTYKREHFNLKKQDFVVLTSFDFHSDVSRKNPAASIEAFIRAFPMQTTAKLVVKSINSQYFREELEVLVSLAEGRSDIVFLDLHLSATENSALLDTADVFISLHRSEGYGINIIDSLARGKPVIATGYSGNLDYMANQTGILVPYHLSAVSNYGGFKLNSFWAEPDIEFAAKMLRKLYEDKSYFSFVGDSAKLKIESKFSLEATVKKFRKEFIYE